MKKTGSALLRAMVSLAAAAALVVSAALPVSAYMERHGYVLNNSVKVYNESQLRDAISRANAGQSIKLFTPIKIRDPIYIEGKSVLLTGDTITWDGREGEGDSIFMVERGSTLAIRDMTVDGAGKAGIAYVHATGELVLQAGGSLVNGYAPKAGGGVYNKGRFTMEGGSVVECSSDEGGGVYNIGLFVMEEGSITGNWAITGNGGGLYNDGSIAIASGLISKNTAKKGAGSGVYHSAKAKRFELGSAPYISDGVYLCKKQTITLSAARFDRGAAVCIEGIEDAKLDRVVATGAYESNDLRSFIRHKEFTWGMDLRGTDVTLVYHD